MDRSVAVSLIVTSDVIPDHPRFACPPQPKGPRLRTRPISRAESPLVALSCRHKGRSDVLKRPLCRLSWFSRRQSHRGAPRTHGIPQMFCCSIPFLGLEIRSSCEPSHCRCHSLRQDSRSLRARTADGSSSPLTKASLVPLYRITSRHLETSGHCIHGIFDERDSLLLIGQTKRIESKRDPAASLRFYDSAPTGIHPISLRVREASAMTVQGLPKCTAIGNKAEHSLAESFAFQPGVPK